MSKPIYNTKKLYLGRVSEARCILVLLGFDGVLDFSKKTGINHQTAGEIVGTVVQKYNKHYPVIIQAHEALNSAYLDRRAMLSKAARAYIKDWVKRWKKFVLDTLVHNESIGKTRIDSKEVNRKQAADRRKKVKAALKFTLDSLKWG